MPYQSDALEPFIDTHTMGLHYQKHYKGYLDKLNQLLQKNHYSYQYPIELLGDYIKNFPEEDREDILFNWGGVVNHVIYFQSISNHQKKPGELLKNKILLEFGGMDAFQKKFKEMALKIKGSGYVFLVVDPENRLQIVSMTNQDCPYFYGLIPLLCVDVWEHAYYINYENRRDFYIDNFLEIMDFGYANKIYERFVERYSIF